MLALRVDEGLKERGALTASKMVEAKMRVND